MNELLIKKLRNAATVTGDWDDDNDLPPFADWSRLMDEAADALEAFEEEEIDG